MTAPQSDDKSDDGFEVVGGKRISAKSAAILRKFAASLDEPCPYCDSDNDAVKQTYFDQNCNGCVTRMGRL